MPKPITLKSVSLAFNDWRRQRTSLGARIPLNLQQQAIELLQFHSKPEVIKALNINHKMLKRWQQQTDTSVCEFINVATDSIIAPDPAPSKHAPLQVTLCNAQGGTMSITGMTLCDLTTLAKHFTASTGDQ